MTVTNRMNSQRKAIIWHEWKKGILMSVTSQLIDKPPATVFSYLSYHSGVEPRARSRRASALTMREWEEISRGIVVGPSIRSIASALSRSPSTVIVAN